MANSEKHFPYFALPPETRNQIMEYVLIPGDVYIRPTNGARHVEQAPKPKPPSSRLRRFVNSMATLSRQLSGRARRVITHSMDLRPKRDFTAQQPGFQLLATCKQAYNEGHHMFYANNTFHLPPGPVNNIDGWYPNLQPKHQKIIRTICIDLSLADLTCGGMDAVECSAWSRRGGRPDNNDGQVWSFEAMYQLELRVWTKVLSLYCCTTPQNLPGFVGLERVIVQSSVGCCVLSSPFGSDESEWVSLKELINEMSRHYPVPCIRERMEEDEEMVGRARRSNGVKGLVDILKANVRSSTAMTASRFRTSRETGVLLFILRSCLVPIELHIHCAQ